MSELQIASKAKVRASRTPFDTPHTDQGAPLPGKAFLEIRPWQTTKVLVINFVWLMSIECVGVLHNVVSSPQRASCKRWMDVQGI